MKAAILVIIIALTACSPGPWACTSPEQKRLEHAAVGDHSPEWMPDGSAIVALADFQLWMVPVDGSSIQSVGSDLHDQLRAAISQSGALAYTESRRLNRACRLERGCRKALLKIARWGPESTRSNPALQVIADYDMAWSADDRLATVSGYGGATTLSTYYNDSYADSYAAVRPFIPGEEIPQQPGINDAKGPVWSPDGRFVASMVFAWTTTDTGTKFLRWYLFVLGAEGAYQKVISLSPESEERAAHQVNEMSMPAWSLDGKQVYYATRTEDGAAPILFAVELQTGDILAVAALEPGSYEAVKMSPTGEQILLVSQSIEHHEDPHIGEDWRIPGDGALYTIQPDGQNLRRIWDGYAHASWSPDGQNIAVWTPLLEEDTWLWLIDPTGTVRMPLIKRDEDGDAVAAGPP